MSEFQVVRIDTLTHAHRLELFITRREIVYLGKAGCVCDRQRSSYEQALKSPLSWPCVMCEEMRRMSDCEGTGLSYVGAGDRLSPLWAPVSSSDVVLDHCCVSLIDTGRGKNDAQETTEK